MLIYNIARLSNILYSTYNIDSNMILIYIIKRQKSTQALVFEGQREVDRLGSHSAVLRAFYWL